MKYVHIQQSLTLVFLLIFLSMTTEAQRLSRSVIGTTGSINEQLSYTVGESVIETATSPTIVLSQGFQQPDRLIGTFVNPFGENTSFSLYPNPTRSTLILEVDTSRPFSLVVAFIDARGREVLQRQNLAVEGASQMQVDVRGLASGSYTMMLLLEDGQMAKSFRFQKVD